MFFQSILSFLSKIFLFTGKLGGSRLFSFERKLPPEKEKEYFARIADAKAHGKSDTEAEEIITKHNLRLVAHIAKKYRSDFSSPDDLISIGSIGLIKAVRTFDPTRAKNFSSYASRCIENEMLMVLRAEKKLTSEISIETSLGSDLDGNQLTIADTLFDNRVDLEGEASKHQALIKIDKIARDVLTGREYSIIERRFGLNGFLPETQNSVAKSLNISRSYISRIESTAINKIREKISQP